MLMTIQFIAVICHNIQSWQGNVPAVGTVPADMFGMGKHYMLNLTIADDSTGGGGEDIFNIITFSANVADWDTVGGTDTPLPQP